jgi:tricorn protease
MRVWLRRFVLFLLILAVTVRARAEESPILLQGPTLNKTDIVFSYGGYLWTVPREGGAARQLTSGGHEDSPIFSPDGKWIAFSANYDGNRDVFVIPAEGGAPKRLTWHPAQDAAVGWTPDGKKVLFVSDRDAYADITRFYIVPAEGGVAEVLPMWRAFDGGFSPDGEKIAYVPNLKWQAAWKKYKGGQTTPIYIVRVKDLELEKVPRQNSNDSSPAWFKDKVYFLSDRNGPVTLFSYDPKSKAVKQELENKGLDFKAVSAGPDALVIEQFGAVLVYDPASGKAKPIHITVSGDLPETRPHFEKLVEQIQTAAISPTGARAVFEAHGEILTAPSEKGDIRNLTRTPSVEERDPSWSPDGKSIAFFSDESGEYALHIVDQSGLGTVKKINLGNPPSFFYSPLWSPDSKKIAYQDKRLNLWYLEVDKGTPVKVATERFDDPSNAMNPTWSPDSKWLTYSKYLESHQHAIFVYAVETAKESQLTDGTADSRYPVFDRDGKTLYFAASTDIGLSKGWLDLSSFQHPVIRNVYAVVLKKTDPNPVEPQSDEEKVAAKPDEKTKDAEKSKETDKKDGDKKDADKKDEPPVVTIDLEGIGQRIVSMPIRAANYVGLNTGKAGILYLQEVVDVPRLTEPTLGTVTKFDLSTRKTEPFVAGVSAFTVSANGEKALFKQGPAPASPWIIAPTAAAPKPGDGNLNLADMEAYVDPRAEWNQMYREVWHIERDFLYDPNHHGLNIPAAEKEYSVYLAKLGGREGLNYLFTEMLGNITIGHMFVGGGDVPKPKQVKGGLLGADYKVENGRYKFARIYDGENWNPNLRAPLTQPGVNVKVGEYLLEVNGRDVRPPADVYSFFEETAGKQIKIKVGPNADGKDSREVTVIPVDTEFPLRNRAWEEDSRRKVDELSGGKLAYVHVPDTATGGYTNFNRFYYAQVGKEGAVIDERYNHGGDIADYIIDYLRRPLRNCAISREGEKFCSPLAQIYGPKTMIINEMSGSGGDALPWMFKQDNVGPLVGTRTWGGLVGIYGYPSLMDGGFVTAPRVAIFGLHGDWEVENHGIAPDIEVENDPASVAAGHDAQLEKAVQVTMEALKKNPVVIPNPPPYPNYQKK